MKASASWSAGCGTASIPASASAWRWRASAAELDGGTASDSSTRWTPASTADSACPPAPPTSPPETKPTAPAAASSSCARSSGASSAPTIRHWSQHLDACLGCRGCEPVCPSGVGYGRGLEAARERLFDGPRPAPLARMVLGVFRPRAPVAAAVHDGAGASRHRHSSRACRNGRLGFAMGMLDATVTGGGARAAVPTELARALDPPPATHAALDRRPLPRLRHGHPVQPRARGDPAHPRGQRLPGHEVPGQVCCGALHEHAGDRGAARALAAAERRRLAVTRPIHRGEQRRVRRPAQGLRPPAGRRRGRARSATGSGT